MHESKEGLSPKGAAGIGGSCGGKQRGGYSQNGQAWGMPSLVPIFAISIQGELSLSEGQGAG